MLLIDAPLRVYLRFACFVLGMDNGDWRRWGDAIKVYLRRDLACRFVKPVLS